MDPDALREEVDEWVREGIITEPQAEKILAHYDDERPQRSRAVLALSLVGAALVFVGMTLFLATNWDDFALATRTIVLVAGPGLAYLGGVAAYDQNVPRVGHALCILGMLLVGPSLFLFEDLYSLGLNPEWLLLTWTAVSLPTGHALGSRVGTGFGLVVLVALITELTNPADPFPAVGLLGVLLFGFGHTRRTHEKVAWTYRVGGAAIAVAALVVVTTLEGRFARFSVEPGATLLAVTVGALAASAWLFSADERTGAEWSAVVIAALALSSGVASLAPETVPEFGAFLGTHLAALGGLFATGYLGYRTRSRTLVDLAALGALLQTLSFVEATVVDALSGSIALVVAGIILLAAGMALERGRRSVLAEF